MCIFCVLNTLNVVGTCMYVPSHVGPGGQSVWKAGMKRTPGPELALTKPPSGNNTWHTIDYTPTMIVYDYIQ